MACGPARIAEISQDTTEGSTDSGTTESETQAETDAHSDGSEQGTFLPLQDVTTEGCDPWQQDCPEGQKCAPYSTTGGNWDANKCVPVMGDQAPGEPCVYGGISEGTDDCDASGMCWYAEEVDGELQGMCVSFCEGAPDAPECTAGFSCPVNGDGTLNICLPTCDPVEQDCADGLACFWVSSSFLCVSTTEDIPLGQPCGFVDDCGAGLMCTAADFVPDCASAACCAAFCDVGLGDAQCSELPGTVCVPFFEEGMAPVEYEHVGICVLPE